MNLPNKLTVIRIALTPVFLFLFCAEFIPHNYLFALIVFVIAAVTDFVDGYIARKRNLITNFGKIADPIADKILMTAVLLGFMQMKLCSIWIVIIILAREFAISAIRIAAAAQDSVIPANVYGKVKTITQMIFSVLIMIFIVLENEQVFVLPQLQPVSSALLWVTAVLTIVSGVIYVRDSSKVINFSE